MIYHDTVIRDDNVWQGHPDVAYFDDRLFVTWREADKHLTDGGTSIKCVSGRIFYHSNRPSFSYVTEPVTIAASPHRLNCPRLCVVDDSLYLVCDEVLGGGDYIGTENTESSTRVMIWKSNDGVNWEGPLHNNVRGIVPDRMFRFNDKYFIATHTGNTGSKNAYLLQNIWVADKPYASHWRKHCIADDPSFSFCEASVAVTPNKQLICLLRENSQLGLPAYCTVSEFGLTWTRPVSTRLAGCHRPVTGFLKSGRLLTTYREASHVFGKRYWAKNTFAHLCDFDSFELNKGIILPLDHDTNHERPDSGYTGWVQLPDESIFVVNYITCDAPKPFIRWYLFTEEDF